MSSKSFQNPTILKILDYYKNLWAISHISAVGHWDLETYMPPLGAGIRGQAMGRLATIRQKLFLDPAFVKLISSAERVKNLNDYEQGVVRVLTRALKFYEKLPPKFLEDFENLTSKSTIIWAEAKNKNDFKLFEPYLKKVFDMNRQMADYLGYSKSPYDALLDQYEEGLTSDKVELFFNEIKTPLKNLLSKIVKSPKYQEMAGRAQPLQVAKYDKNKMVAFNEKVLKIFYSNEDGGLGFGKNFRLDVSAHPFTTSFSKFDTRITTWYQPKSFSESLLATIHEFGHALYDMQSATELEMTPIGGGSSLVIHESQSRFWENFVGRSLPFIDSIISDLRVVTGQKNLKTEEVYAHVNSVSPSLNRVEADEVTYHMHIALRFELEKEIIEEKIKVKDLRDFWNSKMKEYLGVTPKKDSDGVLQDIHWAHGSVGYFPTYSLGTFLAGQWCQEIKNLKRLNHMQKIKNYEHIKKYFRDNVHSFGSTYTLQDLLKKNKIAFDPSVNLKYLEEKYSKLYNF